MGTDKKAQPPHAPGKIKALVAKAMAVKMPGNIPLPVFLGVFFGVFIIGTGVMAYVGLKEIARARKLHPPSPASAIAVKKNTGHSNVSSIGVALSTAAGSAGVITREKASVSAASGGEIDNRVVNFLLHSYEEQKAQLALQDEKIARLESGLAAVEKKPSVPVPQRVASTVPVAAVSPAAATAAPKKAAAAPVAPKKKAPPSPARESSDVKRLAELYTQMKPVDVSSIIEDLDDDTLVRVFAQMKPRTVAKILSLLDPQRAARISKKIAN